MDLRIKPAYDFPGEVRMLFDEYTDMIISEDGSFKEYLRMQNYGKELEHLEQKYGMPDGRLYLAYWKEKLAGCVGLRRMNKNDCEMKRLYVRPEFRGQKIGKRLVDKIIVDAQEIGYAHMLLDTLPFLESAVRLYKQCGFYEISGYNDNPMEKVIYMRLDLQ